MAIAAIAGLATVGGAMAAAGTLAIGWAAAATAFAIGAGLSVISRALMPKPDFGAMMQGVTGTVREATVSRKVIYGRVRVGGAVVFITNSNQNKNLWMVICFACHEVEEYEAVYFNDKKVWENGSFISDWGSYADFAFYDGTQTSADQQLSNASIDWGNTHILNGIAYMRVNLLWDEDRKKFPQGVPNISAVIKGKKLYSPETSETSAGSLVTGTSYVITSVSNSDFTLAGARSNEVGVEFVATGTTTGTGKATELIWSQNPSLVLRDYMTNKYYGLGESFDNIDDVSFYTAKNVCDEPVSLDDGSSHARYHCDGVIDTANTIKGNIEALTACMGGRIGYVDGKYFVQPAKYYSPTITIDESHMIGPISIQTKQSRRSQYNAVKGTFLSEEENYTLVDYPAKISSSYAADDGDPIYLDMPLPFVTNNVRAQRLAKIALLKSRQQVLVNVPLNLAGLKFKAGDFIGISNTRMGWSSKPFEVIGYDLNIGNDGAITVNLQAIETDSTVYDWTAASDEDPFNSPNDPTVNDGTTVGPPQAPLNITETSQLAKDGKVISALKISWTASDDGFVEYYEVEVTELVGNVEQTDTTIFNTTRLTQLLVTGIRTPNVSYRVKVRAVNVIGVKSSYLTNATAFTATGDNTAPSAPTSLTATGTYKAIIVTWTNPTDIDLKEIEIHRADTSGGTYSKIAVVTGESYTDQVLTFGTTKYYKAKAVDYSGNVSGFSNADSGTTTFVDTGEFTAGVESLFANANVKEVDVVSSLPASGDYTGQVVFLTADNKLYRWTGSAWTSAVAATDMTGEITTVQIADDAIEAPKIKAGAITTAKMTVGTIDADRLLANSITGGLIAAAGIITSTAQIDDGLITNLKIANGAITTAKIDSLQVTTAKIANNAVTIPDGETFVATLTDITTSWANSHEITVDFGSGWADVGSVLVFGNIFCKGVLGSVNTEKSVFARVAKSDGTSPRGQVEFRTDRPGRGVSFAVLGELPGPSAQSQTYTIQVKADYYNTSGGYWEVGNGTMAVMGSKK